MSPRPFPPPESPPRSAPVTAGAERLRVGDCLVDLALREIHAPGARRPRRVTPKAIAVLLALVAQPGKVVGRDALLAQVWPDTLPTDDVLTQAVTQLRKAFGEQRGQAPESPRYIETIAKTGYRLLAPVEWLEESAQAGSEPATPPAHSGEAQAPAEPPAAASPAADAVPAAGSETDAGVRFARPVMVAIAIVLALLLLVLWIVLAQETTSRDTATGQWLPRNERPFRLITSKPGFELAPTLSPDAAMVAYVARPPDSLHTVLMVQTTGQSRARALTRPPSGFDDSSPEWSPDGREIAFLRIRHHGDCRIMVVPAAGGSERTVAGCDPRSPPSFAWKPDGSALLFGADADAPGEVGLRELDLASGDWRSLLYTYRRDDVDAAPRYSPDGRWIVFVRNSPLGDFWRIPAAGGEAERLTDLRGDIHGWDWGPGGDSLLFGIRIDGDTRLYQLELGSSQPRDLGIADALAPATVSGSRSFAFVQRKPYFGLLKVERDDAGGGEPPASRRLFASSGRDVMPAIAPDGEQLVFLSDRAGPNGLWWARLGQPDSLRHLAGVRPDARHAPEWSSDSRRLLVSGSVPGGAPGIFEVTPASGQVSRLPIPIGDPLQAVYLPDPEQVLVVAGAVAGRPRLILFDRSTPVWQPLAAINDVSRVQVDHANRRLLFSRHSRGGLWQAALDLDPASVRQVSPLPNAANYRMWEVDDRGRIMFIEQREECATWLQPAAGDAPGRCLYAEERSSRLGFSLAPRNGPIFITPAVYDNADIGFMELPPERQSFVPGWLK